MSRSRFVQLIAVLFAVVWTACADSTGPRIAVTATTDATSYIADPVPGSAPLTRYSFRVVVRTTNHLSRPVELARCSSASTTPMFGVQLHGGGTAARSAYDPAWGCFGGAPIVLGPGAERFDTLTIVGPTIFNGVSGEPIGIADGTMSLHLSSDNPRIVTNRFLVARGQ